MRPGRGFAVSSLNSDAKHIAVIQAEDSYVYVTTVDASDSSSHAITITLTDEDALALAAAIRKAARR